MKTALLLASLSAMVSLSGCGGLGDALDGLVGGGAPTLTSLSPNSGTPGTTITPKGTNLDDGSNPFPVTFNGRLSGPEHIVDATHITAVVPTGATTGPVVVTNPTLIASGNAGTSSGINFTFQ